MTVCRSMESVNKESAFFMILLWLVPLTLVNFEERPSSITFSSILIYIASDSLLPGFQHLGLWDLLSDYPPFFGLMVQLVGPADHQAP